MLKVVKKNQRVAWKVEEPKDTGEDEDKTAHSQPQHTQSPALSLALSPQEDCRLQAPQTPRITTPNCERKICSRRLKLVAPSTVNTSGPSMSCAKTQQKGLLRVLYKDTESKARVKVKALE